MVVSAPQYVIAEDQPGGSQRYCLNGIYPGYLVGTGGAGDVTTAMTSLANLIGGSQIECIKWSGSLGSLSCGAPFSTSGYDGTLNALTGFNGHVVLGLPLVEGSLSQPSGMTNQTCTTTNGSPVIATNGTMSTYYLNVDVSGPGIPARCYVGAIGTNNFTIYSYTTHAPINATSVTVTVNGVTTTTNVTSSTMSFSWRLHHVTAGAHDARFTAIAAAIVARGWTRQKMTVLLGWEMDGSWPWGTNSFDPSTNSNQTAAQYIAAFQHVVTVMRAVSGFTNRFEWNTNWQNSTYYNGHIMPPGYPGDAYCDVLGWDAYNSIGNAYSSTNTGGIQRTDFARLWTDELKPSLDNLVAMAKSRDSGRAGLGLAPLVVGHSECGVIVYPDSQSGSTNYKFHTADTALYWSNMHAYWTANADRFAYIIFFNQNQSSGNVTTEDNQLYYSGSLSGQTLTYYHNTSTHGPWVRTPSTYHTLSLADYEANMIAGSMQLQDVALPSRVVLATDNSIYNFFYPFG